MAQGIQLEDLDQLPLTAEFSVSVRQALSEIATYRTVAAGGLFCLENEPITELFLIVRGRVGLDMFVPGRGQVRIQTIGPGEILAWSAVVGEQLATATGAAIEETQAIVLPAASLLRLCETNNELGYVIMRQLAKNISRRLVTTRLQLLDLFAER